MIQRIQTVFLFLAIIALGLFIYFPYWQALPDEAGNRMMLAAYGQVLADGTVVYGLYSLVAGLAGLVMVVMAVEIFSYKNRLRQMQLAILNSFLMIINLGLMTWFVIDLQKEYEGLFGLGLFVFALAMILNILARRFIQKDEQLVRSMDRLR